MALPGSGSRRYYCAEESGQGRIDNDPCPACRSPADGTGVETKDGTAVRDYVHVIDLAKGHFKALLYLMENNQNSIFNLGNGDGFTVNDVIKTIENTIDKKVNCTICPRRSGDPDVLVANSRKAKEVLNWSPQYSLKKIIETAWKWHHENPKGFSKLP